MCVKYFVLIIWWLTIFNKCIFDVANVGITWNWARQVIKSNTDISDFSFSSADAKAILKNHILLTQKMGNSCEWNKYRDKLVLFWFSRNLSKSLNKTNMIEKNLICCYHSTEVELCDHPSIHIQTINGKIFPETSLINLAFSSG